MIEEIKILASRTGPGYVSIGRNGRTVVIPSKVLTAVIRELKGAEDFLNEPPHKQERSVEWNS